MSTPNSQSLPTALTVISANIESLTAAKASMLSVNNPISNVYKNTSSVDCTQNGLYNLKQYDHYKILNELVHITLFHTINICAELKLYNT